MIRQCLLAVIALTFCTSVASLIRAEPAGVRGWRSGSGPRYLNPMGVALSPDGRRAYVALNGVRMVAEVELGTGQVLRQFETGDRPTEVFRDGGAIFVADVDADYLRIDLAAAESTRDGTSRLRDGRVRRRAAIELAMNDQTGSIGLHLDVEPDWSVGPGLGAVTDQVFANSLKVTGPYNSSTPVVAGRLGLLGGLGFGGGGFDMKGSLDTGRNGAADPADAVWSPAAKMLFVAAAGSDAVLGIKTRPIQATVREVLARPEPPQVAFGWGDEGAATRSAVFHNLTPVVLRTQSNPRRLTMSDDGRTIVVSNTLSDSLTVIAVDDRGPRVVKHILLNGPKANAARRGEILFHSARLTFNRRFSCASCHPGGGSDGRVWDTPTEDPGPRRTKPLWGVRDTAPYGWHGDSPTLADRVRKTLGRLHRFTPSPGEVDDLVAYLASLPAPKPKEMAFAAREDFERGRSLFEGKARCARCHEGPSLQDGQMHDVGLGGKFRTPSLRGVADRHSLLHDGRVGQVETVFQACNEQKQHGAAHLLTKAEFEDLMLYVKSR